MMTAGEGLKSSFGLFSGPYVQSKLHFYKVLEAPMLFCLLGSQELAIIALLHLRAGDEYAA